MKRALFVDRDGTVIEDKGYLCDPAGIKILPGASEALAALAHAGWKIIIVSNQSGVGRGMISPGQMEAVQARFIEIMQTSGVPITAAYICIHSPEDQCECRKPSTHFLEQAAREHSLDLGNCCMIGDREGDIVCGRNAGCSTIWLRNDMFRVRPGLPDWIAPDWSAIRNKLAGAC
jgi:D-glycero-D-manno-heptose 1,7-bisphosphate phosphatase